MSYAQLMTTAAKQSQGILAQLGGAQPGRKNFVIEGVSYYGVLHEREAQVPSTATGYEIINALVITATKDQFDSPPSAAPRALVAALGRQWYVVAVRDAFPSWELTCKPV